MLYNYGLHQLELELERQQKEKSWTEKYFEEKWSTNVYKRFCVAVDRVEQLEKAIKILKNGLDNSNEFA